MDIEMRSTMLAVLGLSLCMGGCASVTKGTTQKLTINTSPQGATCVLKRDGATIARVAPTPGTVEISKSQHDIEVDCNKPGYPRAVGRLNSELEAMTFGNLLIGGLVGVAVDYGTGAMNKYDKSITVPLNQNTQPAQQPERRPTPRKPVKPVV